MTENLSTEKNIDSLRKGLKRYKTLFESMDDGYCIIQLVYNEQGDPVDYRYLEVNRAFEEQTGLENPEGKTIMEMAPGHEFRWVEIYDKVARTGEPIRYEDEAAALNRWFTVYAYPIGEPEERRLAVHFRDITRQKKAEEEREKLLREVKAERERLEDIFQHAPSFMCILREPDHRFERANKLYYRLIGKKDIIGKTVREVFPQLQGEGFFSQLDRVYQTGEPYRGTDVPVRLFSENPDSESTYRTRYVDFVYQPLRDASGEITGIFVQGVDLTERRKAKEELQEMNETLEERVEERTASLLAYQDQLRSLASQLSRTEERERHRLATELHDNIGQLLAVGKMKLDLLMRDRPSEEGEGGLAELGELMDEAIGYTRQLMSELKPPPSLETEDLSTGIEWVAEKMTKHGLNVSVEDDGRPKPLSEEVESILRQSVKELLYNVIKHAEVDEARVEVTRQDNWVEITVSDRGIGFDPGDEQPAPKGEGGFGIFNIRERMDWLGGSLKIDSEPGSGTTMVLQAPVEDPETDMEKADLSGDTGTSPWQRVPRRASPSSIGVLLVDDHKMIREGLRKMIEEQSDITVMAEASNGVEAVEIARKIKPDVIVMDVNMPEMNGIDATRQILEEQSDVRVIGLSLEGDQSVVRAMRNAGASAYLTKADVFESLCATIRTEAGREERE